MAKSSEHKPSNINDALEDITLRLSQVGVTNENNSDEASTIHAQSSYGYRYSQPQVSQTTNTDNNLIGLSIDAKNGKNKINQVLRKMKKEILRTASTPNGSCFLQTMMAQNIESRELIFESVYEYLFDFLINGSATNVFARLVELCDENKLRLIVEKLTMNKDRFACAVSNRFSANSIKRLIKVLEESPLVSAITSLLARDFRTLMSDHISSYVIIKCFECLSVQQNKELFEATIRDCVYLATNEKACVALNESIPHFKQPYRDHLLSAISSQARFLSQDPTGNYVVQQVLELWHPYFTYEICRLLNGHFARLSMKKCSSRVVEKCLLSDVGVDMILQEFINCERLWKVARDQNGNYVIQKALDLAKGSRHYEAFVERLHRERHLIEPGNGKHVYYKLMNL